VPEPASARPAAADRNLLFGVLALQLDFIGRDALIAAMNAWVLDKAKPLDEILVAQGALAPDCHALLQGLVQKHLQRHGGDPQKSLAALPSPALAELGGIPDPDVQASLVHVAAAQPGEEHNGNAAPGTNANPVQAATTPPPAAARDPEATLPTGPVAAPAVGTRFRILRPHAKGGLGEVSVARDEELDREVALKEIQSRYADDDASRSRFLLEARVTGGLEHPGIVPVYALGHYPDGRPYYAMRLIKGDSLKDAIDRFHKKDTPGLDPDERDLALRQLLRRFIDVCNAVEYAHSRGVLHRDLKPANVMLGPYGETLVVDWGLAKPVGRPEEARASGELTLRPLGAGAPTQMGQALGTPAYMSPEQAAGRLDLLGPASDVYSLGATFYSLLTGKAPFDDPDLGQLLSQVQRGEFPTPRMVNAKIPAPLEAVCLKAMALQPEGRYPSARALADDLEHWLADRPVSAWPEPWPVRIRRWLGRHRLLVTGATAALVVALVGSAAAALLLAAANDRERRAKEHAQHQEQLASTERAYVQRERDIGRRNLYAAHMALAQQAWRDAHIGRLNELLEGWLPERAGGEERRGFEWNYLNRLTHTERLSLKGHTGPVRGVAYSPDGTRLASASNDGTVKVWDAATGQLALSLTGHTAVVLSVAYSPDGKRLASAGGELDKPGEVKVWDLATGQEALSLKGHTSEVLSVAYSPDGKRLAGASYDGTVRVWDAATGQEALSLKGHTHWVFSVAYSPDGKRLASASYDGTVRVWDAATGQEALSLKGHTGWVESVAYSPDGKRLAGTSYDGAVKVWDAATGQLALSLKGHTGAVWSVAYSPDGKRLASASQDNTVKVWDLATGQEALSLKGHTGAVWSVAYSPDGKRLASASEDGTVRVWDAATGQEAIPLKGHTGPVRSVAYSPDGKRLASASGMEVKVWDAATGQLALSLQGDTGRIKSVAFSPDSKRLASAGGELDKPWEVKVWDAATGQLALSLKGHTGWVTSVAYSPDGQRLASASEDGTVRVWDAATGQEALSLRGHTGSVHSVAYSPDGQRLASAGGELGKPGEVQVWDAATGQLALSLKGHTSGVTCVAYSPDGQRLASAGGGAGKPGEVQVWDAATGQLTLSLIGHSGPVYSMAYSPDGQRLVSASGDRTVKVWDTESGHELLSLQGHTRAVYSVAFSPDGKRLASADYLGEIKIWEACLPTPGQLVQREAVQLVAALFTRLLLREDVLKELQQAKVPEPVIQAALHLARLHPEDPFALNKASWRVVAGRTASPAAIAKALHQAEAACRVEPDNGGYLNTLGVARYRAGKYPEALETLTRSDRLNSARYKSPQPADVAFLAMTYHHLGQPDKAQAALARLRELVKKPVWSNNQEATAFLREAEPLIVPGKP
jgi:WD40 repeat protein/tRNA A-37 threonylcarbamoyl transferase component Bud32